jgi:hypothetical protein
MKRATVLLITLLLSFSLYAQTDTIKSKKFKIRYGVNVSYNFTRYITEAISPCFELRVGNQNFMIGPLVYVNRESPHLKYSRTGVNYSYKIFPNPTSRIFNFYFLYNFQFAMDRKKENVDYYNYSNIHLIGSITRTEYSITNCIGYGYKMRIVKGFYLNNSIGVGIGLFRNDSRADYPDVPSASHYDKGSMFGYGQPTIFANLGFGYDF